MKRDHRGDKLGYRQNRNILIDEYKVIYFLIPKVACTTIKTHILNNYLKTEYTSPHQHDYPFVEIKKLNTEYLDYLKFAVVRNPWSRVVSCYNDKIAGRKVDAKHIFARYGDLFYDNMTFKEFVKAVCSVPHSRAEAHFISQLYRLTDFSGELMPNYIAKLENPEPYKKEIHEASGFSLFDIGHRHKGQSKKSYTEYYDEETKEMVREKYRSDIEIFGYTFEPDSGLEHIGFTNVNFSERLNNAPSLIPILKEKNKELEDIRKYEKRMERGKIESMLEKISGLEKLLEKEKQSSFQEKNESKNTNQPFIRRITKKMFLKE